MDIAGLFKSLKILLSIFFRRRVDIFSNEKVFPRTNCSLAAYGHLPANFVTNFSTNDLES